MRRVLNLLLIAFAAPAWMRAESPSSRPARSDIVLSVPVTHSDWMLHHPAPAWGPAGVRQILDRCREAGLRRVYWRCLDGGRACYPSKLVDPLHGFDDDNYHRGQPTEKLVEQLKAFDWGSFDAFREAIDYGHKLGLEVHAWLTINEDDHGWGLSSRFARAHPESRWVRRGGQFFRSQQSLAFATVRAYKLGIVREVMAYHPDGVLFDWIRTGDVRDNPQTDGEGVALYGYEAPNLERLRAINLSPDSVRNDDERWVRIRAEPQTLFMRDAAALIRKTDARARITALVQQSHGYRGTPQDTIYRDNLHGLLLDVAQWAREGLVDCFVGAGYYRPGGSPEAGYHSLRAELGHKVDMGLFGWIASPAQFESESSLAGRLGATELLLWESDYLELPPARADLVRMMSAFATAHDEGRPASRPR